MGAIPANSEEPVKGSSASLLRGALEAPVVRIDQQARTPARRLLPEEVAIALEYNGLSYAVMMGSPLDLADFAIGFSLSEQIVTTADEVLEISIRETDHGWLIRLWLAADCAERLSDRTRLRTGEGSCGLCGLQTLAQVQRPLPLVPEGRTVEDTALFKALAQLSQHQPLNANTGGVHAAAFCSRDGNILLLREDVGRHNALDKLIGALALAAHAASDGFFLVSSRCSYELVEKTVIAGCPLLVTISTATSLAVERARGCGLTLVALARSDAMLELSSSRS